MCGIAGFLTLQPTNAERAENDLRNMARAIEHRGPDAEGFWQDATAGAALCHRRLSIIDLSPLGSQPMRSASGRFVIVFNGEIYNYRDLRRDLQIMGSTFRGGSDTEVLLAGIEHWGLEATIHLCRGMFAFALWDTKERVLHLVRDRFGEKPLYYGESGGVFLFGSELKALRAHSSCHPEINRDALALLLRHYYIPGPHTIYRGIVKLAPGCIVRIRAAGHRFELQERRYWMPQALAATNGNSSRPVTDAEAVDRIETVLAEAVKLQMVADVPVGAFLSGGIDSSLIVALMQKASTRPVRTFSIGQWDSDYDEAPFARRIAEHLGTQHTELTVTPGDALAVIPKLPDIYDEPFADSSQIPTYLVSRLARQHVSVSLSGDGGDELFGGYPQYPFNLEYWSRVRRMPPLVRAAFRQVLRRMPLQWIEFLTQPARWVARGQRNLADRIKERSAVVFAGSFPEHYRAQLSFWQWPGEVVMGAHEPDTVVSRREEWPTDTHEFAQMMYIDTCQYLPDDILVKVDRAAMATSLETRVPLLDPRVAAAVWSIPLEIHNRGGTPKWVLREVLARHVPREMFDRPKRGFSIPIGRWLRGELREWAGDLLDGARLRRQGILEPRVIERRWQQHRDGIADWSVQLWTVLMFQAWHERWSA